MSAVSFLLVDDEKPFIETIARRLRQRGFSVECAFSGIEALNRLENNDVFDIVVLDIKMPGLDGIKTLEIIKKEHPLLEVIMLTGHADVHSAIEALKIGAFDYLTKPYDLNDLISKAKLAASRKKDRESKILNARTKPYTSKRDRDKLISEILDT
jgi:DNA-binding NtrC family response regulator